MDYAWCICDGVNALADRRMTCRVKNVYLSFRFVVMFWTGCRCDDVDREEVACGWVGESCALLFMTRQHARSKNPWAPRRRLDVSFTRAQHRNCIRVEMDEHYNE